MTDIKKIHSILKKFFYVYLFFVFFLSFLSPVSISAIPQKAIIGPISTMGEIPSTVQQILFNQFRELINKKYYLVSHKVLELISEQGFSSYDIEDCTSSRCVRKILNFLNNLKNKYKADNLFLLQITKSKSETQLSLKLSSLSFPEITKKIVNKSCIKCNFDKLKISLELVVKNMFDSLGFKDLDEFKTKKTYEMGISEKKVDSMKKNLKKGGEALLEVESISKDKPKIPESIKKSEFEKKKNVPKAISDPYIIDRDLYNQHIGRLLTDVTYALQIFRSGMFVQIEVTIDNSGTVVNQKVTKSSGSKDFDETAIMTLEEIQFDPLPKTMLKFGHYVVNLQIHNSR